MRRTDRDELLKCIDTTSFAVDDIVLYLDTHPQDKEALAYYEKCNALRKQAVDEYTTHFGPLTADRVNSTNKWTWIEDPWPWETRR